MRFCAAPCTVARSQGALCAQVFTGHLFGLLVAVKQLKVLLYSSAKIPLYCRSPLMMCLRVVVFQERPAASDDKQFTAEMELLCRVTHTSICRLFAFSTDGLQRCLVLELCTGGSLEDRIDCASAGAASAGGGGGCGGGGGGGRAYPPLQWDHRLRIAVAIAQALKHLHTLTPPMLHRDVKSANVLLDEAGNAKVPRIRQQNCAAPSPTPASNLRANF